MSTDRHEKLTRVNYEGTLAVTTRHTQDADFAEYTAPLWREHHAALHGPGIASGLEVSLNAGATGLVVGPGAAVDGAGRLIVLADGGRALIGDPGAAVETGVPVELSAAGVAGQRVLVTVRARETLRTIPAGPLGNIFPAGKLEHTPLLQLTPADTFTANADVVVLAVADVAADGQVGAPRTMSGADSRTRTAQEVGRLVVARPLEIPGPPASVGDVAVGGLAPLTGGGVELTVRDPAAAVRVSAEGGSNLARLDLFAEHVRVRTPRLETRTAADQVIVSLTPEGLGVQEPGRVTIADAGGVAFVTLGRAGTGGGSIQVRGSDGKLTAELSSSAGPAGRLRLLGPNEQAGVELRPDAAIFQGGIWSKGWIQTDGGFQINGVGKVYVTASGSDGSGGSLTTRTKNNTSGVQLGVREGNEDGWVGVFNKAGDSQVRITADVNAGMVFTRLANGNNSVALSYLAGQGGWLGVYDTADNSVVRLYPGGVWSKGWIQTDGGFQINGVGKVFVSASGSDGSGGSLTTRTKNNTSGVQLGVRAGNEDGWLGVFNKAGDSQVRITADANAGMIFTRLANGNNSVALSYLAGQGGWLGVYDTADNAVVRLYPGGVWSKGWIQTDGGFQINGVGKVFVSASGSDGSGGSLTTRTKNNTSGVQLGVRDGAEDGWLGVFNKAGDSQVRITADADGGMFFLRNKANKNAIGMWCTAEGHGVLSVYDGSGALKHQLFAGGPKGFVMPHPEDASKNIVYGCVEGPEAGAYVRGRAALAGGKTRVDYPDHFRLVINPDTVTVQLTPRSARSRGLAVTAQDGAGFVVEELSEGRGSYEFDYFVTGVRRGFEGYRPVVERGMSAMGGSMMPAGLAAEDAAHGAAGLGRAAPADGTPPADSLAATAPAGAETGAAAVSETAASRVPDPPDVSSAAELHAPGVAAASADPDEQRRR